MPSSLEDRYGTRPVNSAGIPRTKLDLLLRIRACHWLTISLLAFLCKDHDHSWIMYRIDIFMLGLRPLGAMADIHRRWTLVIAKIESGASQV